MRHGSNEHLKHHDEESDLNLGKGINGLKKFQTVDVANEKSFSFSCVVACFVGA